MCKPLALLILLAPVQALADDDRPRVVGISDCDTFTVLKTDRTSTGPRANDGRLVASDS